MSHDTLYLVTAKDKERAGKLWRHLKWSRNRYGVYDGRGRLASKEGALRSSCVVEMRSRSGTIPPAPTAHTVRCTVELLEPEKPRLKTITTDNGTEFHSHKEIEPSLGARFYFATPHHTWEPRTKENINDSSGSNLGMERT